MVMQVDPRRGDKVMTMDYGYGRLNVVTKNDRNVISAVRCGYWQEWRQRC